MDDQLNPKIRHLAVAQIEALISRYYDGEHIDALLQEFQIDCHPSQLCKLFPPEVLPEKRCPYCEVAMVRERLSRTSARYSRQERHCPSCGHRDEARHCRCVRCQADEQRESERRRSEQTRKILEYCRRTWPFVWPSPTARDLGLREAVALLALARTCPFDESSGTVHVGPDHAGLEARQHAPAPFAPQGQLGGELLHELREAGLLAISELSGAETFEFEGAEISGYYPNKVWWATLADPHQLLNDIEQTAYEPFSWPPHWASAVKGLWFDIALAECKEYYRHCAAERGLPESGATSTDAMLRNLLRDYSVSQCYRIIWAAARDTSDFLLRRKCTRSHAANYMIGVCQRWADRARADNWYVQRYKRILSLPRSSISHVLFDVFLKIGEAGFNDVPR